MALRKKPETEERTRFVRVALTEDEHSLLRAAAAAADLSLSQYAVRAIVTTAQQGAQQIAAKVSKRSPKEK